MTIQDYIYDTEDLHLQRLLEQTHYLLLDLLPEMQTAIKWRVPYYTYKKPLCYLNTRKDHIYISFLQGTHLSNVQGLLKSKNHKLIRYIDIYTEEDIYKEALAEVILEAAEVNDHGWKKK